MSSGTGDKLQGKADELKGNAKQGMVRRRVIPACRPKDGLTRRRARVKASSAMRKIR